MCVCVSACTRRGPPPVRTQLCLALVALTVHVPAERWALPGVAVPESLSGGGAVAWFAVKLQAVPPDVALPCLLELLTVLPQVRVYVCVCVCAPFVCVPMLECAWGPLRWRTTDQPFVRAFTCVSVVSVPLCPSVCVRPCVCVCVSSYTGGEQYEVRSTS